MLILILVLVLVLILFFLLFLLPILFLGQACLSGLVRQGASIPCLSKDVGTTHFGQGPVGIFGGLLHAAHGFGYGAAKVHKVALHVQEDHNVLPVRYAAVSCEGCACSAGLDVRCAQMVCIDIEVDKAVRDFVQGDLQPWGEVACEGEPAGEAHTLYAKSACHCEIFGKKQCVQVQDSVPERKGVEGHVQGKALFRSRRLVLQECRVFVRA